MAVLLEANGLTKYYGPKPALDHLDIKMESGKIIGLLGPNGSGKTTLIKLANGLLRPTVGTLYIDGHPPGTYTKSIVAYLPDKNYLNDWMRVQDLVRFFSDFYGDFDAGEAFRLLADLDINPDMRLKTLSKGNKEKVQLILVMSRKAKLYLLDEPIAGVDPAARDYILRTILSHYNPEATVLISTHLIADIEQILDEVIFLKNGALIRHSTVDSLRAETGMSVDGFFREVFRC